MLTAVDDCTASAQLQSNSLRQHNIYKRHYTPKRGAEEKHLLDAQKETLFCPCHNNMENKLLAHRNPQSNTDALGVHGSALQDIF